MDNLPQQRTGLTSSESAVSAVSWPAIFAGAFVAAASSMLLFTLGAGFGFASMSPWPGSGLSATGSAVMAGVWLVVVQWVASAVGGYLAGRMRTKWAGLHTHEVFFRDTAHGFITWAVSTTFVALAVALSAGATLSAASHAAAGIAGGAMTAAMPGGPEPGPMGRGTGRGEGMGHGEAGAGPAPGGIAPYDVDLLFRSTNPSGSADPASARAEAARILARDLPSGDLPAADRTYLAQLVAARAGISQEDAQQRVDAVVADLKATETKAREAADTARKAAAKTAILTALSMLIGAFVACVAAALGGHRRDEHA
jgi:hypothetical protein